MHLNYRAHQLVEQFLAEAEASRVVVHSVAGARVIDCGVHVPGGLAAGLWMTRIAMAGLSQVRLPPEPLLPGTGLAVSVTTDQPLWSCLAAQYAGWPINVDGYFAMGSGPMRYLRGREELLGLFGSANATGPAVGVLESAKLPTEAAVRAIADECGVPSEQLTLLVAPTRSIAGGLQIVARSVETALHKLYEVTKEHEFDMWRVVSGAGSAPLPPPSPDDLTAIGRTNDAILYGARVTLWIETDNATLSTIGAKLPSCSSRDYGRPFKEIFDSAGGDFYAIDPHLFSPAAVQLISTTTGDVVSFGRVAPELLARSFGPETS